MEINGNNTKNKILSEVASEVLTKEEIEMILELLEQDVRTQNK
jgi:hypothetical protein